MEVLLENAIKADQAVSKYTLIFRKISKVFELKKRDLNASY